MRHSFRQLNWAQFTGAFIDNAFKMLAIIWLVQSLGRGLPEVLSFCSLLFIAPFLLFSNVAGALADRFSKRDIIVASKGLEIVLLLAATALFFTGTAWPVYLLLFLLCTQSALFGPSKRGIVPELVESGNLSRANGQLTAATYGAIILGSALPAITMGFMGSSPLVVLIICIALALTGLLASLRIERVRAAGIRKSSSPWIIPDVVRAIRNVKQDAWALQAIWGLVLFGGIMAFCQQTLMLFARDALNLSVEKSPLLFLLAAIGIGLGALLTGRFSKHTIEIGLIPVGAMGIMAAALGLSLAAQPIWVGLWIVVLGMSCGMYLVPLNAFVQQRLPAERRGEAFGAISFLSFSAMVLSSGLFYLLTRVLHVDARTCVFLTGLMAAVPAVVACMRLPSFFTRFWVIRLVKRVYRLRVEGLENLPREGGALLICNHTAYADPLLLQAATQRPLRFLMSRDVFKTWAWCRPIFRLANCIPIHTSDGPRALATSLQAARKAMQAGALIGIFPEGELTPDGSLQTFNRGFERIAKQTNCPIIPAHIDNLWGSIFSFQRGKPGFKRPLHLPYPVALRFGEPLPSDTTAEEAQRVIAELGAQQAAAAKECACLKRTGKITLPEMFPMKLKAAVLVALIVAATLGLAVPRSEPVVEPPITADEEVVVLLHGLARSERAMNKMARALRDEGYRVINHDYPSTSASIEALSKAVFDVVTPQVAAAKKVHFVTHSMGGIILRQHLESHKIPNLGRTVMLAPPSQGSEVTDKLGNNIVYKWINGPAGNQLGTGTNSLPLRLKAPAFELGIIAGDRSVNPILSMLIPGPDDGKVALARVKPEAMTDYLQLHATHTCMMWNRTVIDQTKHFLAHGAFEL